MYCMYVCVASTVCVYVHMHILMYCMYVCVASTVCVYVHMHILMYCMYVRTVLFIKNWTMYGGQTGVRTVYVRWPSGVRPLYARLLYGFARLRSCLKIETNASVGKPRRKAPYAESSSSFSIWLSTSFKSAAVFFPVKPLPGYRPILPSFAYFLKNSATPDFDTTCPSLAKSSAIFRKLLPSRLKSRIRCFT